MRKHLWRYRLAGGLLAVSLAGCGALATTPPATHGTGTTAVLTPYPTTAASAIRYQEALTSATSGWATGQVCVFNASGMSVLPQQGQAYICLAPVPSMTDLAVSVTVTQTSGPTNHAYGIAFRHNDPKSYDFFGIDSQGRFTVTVVINDRSTTIMPFAANAAIRRGLAAKNQLQVIMSGSTATLLVNGTAVGQATLSDFASGTIGLRGTNDGAIIFRDLVIAAV